MLTGTGIVVCFGLGRGVSAAHFGLGGLRLLRGEPGRPGLKARKLYTPTGRKALAEDDNSEECAILCESGARPGVLWFAS